MAWSYTYHLTWTCYGQWLRGDVRGYVEDGCNEPGTPYAWGDARGHNADANRMAETACWLTDAQRRVAEEAIGEACVFRRWNLLAVNVQPDHVHAVLEAPEVDGKRARQILKDRATRALRPVGGSRRRWWTEGGKVDAIRSEAQLREVVEYVRNRQPFKRVGEGASPATSAFALRASVDKSAAGVGVEAGVSPGRKDGARREGRGR